MKKIIVSLVAAAAVIVSLAGCSQDSLQQDQYNTDSSLKTLQKNQPMHRYTWSQYRQTLLDVQDAQANGVTTTSFFYNMGSNKPVKSCPSIGFPVASTTQLTNPLQVDNGSNGAVVAQAEPTGVYTGQSAGTYVVCVAKSGQKYITYWEGDVETEGGPAHWDSTTSQIVLDGAPTVTTKSAPGK